MPKKGPTTKELLIQILGKVNGLEEQMNQRFEQMDTKFEKRFEQMDKRMNKIEKRIDQIDQFIKRDANIIEEELNSTMMKHIQKEFPGYDIESTTIRLKPFGIM